MIQDLRFMNNSNKPQKITMLPTYVRETELWVRDLKPELVIVNDITFTETSLIRIPTGQLGGNHLHPRVELFCCLAGELEIVWLDENEKQQNLIMETNHEKEMTGYVMPSGLAHAVRNVGKTDGFLLEFASEKQHEVQIVNLFI
jgi:oxalate decarboxylase/phosphoglucose isomerase-like protein (cupin superfamily)